MNNYSKNTTSSRKPTSEVEQLTASLICTFRLDDHCQQVLKAQQKSETLEEAVHRWVLDTLLMPDKKLGALIMPILAQRFHNYIESIRKMR